MELVSLRVQFINGQVTQVKEKRPLASAAVRLLEVHIHQPVDHFCISDLKLGVCFPSHPHLC